MNKKSKTTINTFDYSIKPIKLKLMFKGDSKPFWIELIKEHHEIDNLNLFNFQMFLVETNENWCKNSMFLSQFETAMKSFMNIGYIF